MRCACQDRSQFSNSVLARSDRSHRLTAAIGLMIVMLLATCPTHVAAIDQAAKQVTDPAKKEALPEADQLAFATAFETAAKDGEPAAMNKLINWSALLDLAIAGEKSPALNRARNDFKRGFIENMKKENKSSFSSQIVETVKAEGSFKFIRLGNVDDQPFALFRLKMAGGGTNYFQFFLSRSKDGLVRTHDIFVFLTAERLSDTLRRVWLPVSSEILKTATQKRTQPEDALITALISVPQITRFIQDGDGQKALTSIHQLPAKVRVEKIFLVLEMRAAQLVSDEEYAATIETFRKVYPTDAALDFILIDGYFLKKDYAQALGCIDRTNQSIGGDSYLVSMRALLLAYLDRFEEAETAADEAIKMEPDQIDSYWNAITVSITTKNHDETVRLLNLVDANFAVKFDDLTKIPAYADFVKSSQYAKWMESRK